jgi:hypothetical protein
MIKLFKRKVGGIKELPIPPSRVIYNPRYVERYIRDAKLNYSILYEDMEGIDYICVKTIGEIKFNNIRNTVCGPFTMDECGKLYYCNIFHNKDFLEVNKYWMAPILKLTIEPRYIGNLYKNVNIIDIDEVSFKKLDI